MIRGNKLPKEFWVKGKSKFLYPRLQQEGIEFGNQVWDGAITGYSPVDRLYRKLRGEDWSMQSIIEILKKNFPPPVKASWYVRFVYWFKSLFTRKLSTGSHIAD